MNSEEGGKRGGFCDVVNGQEKSRIIDVVEGRRLYPWDAASSTLGRRLDGATNAVTRTLTVIKAANGVE